MTRRGDRQTRVPTLPCLTIARSPANDVRVIVDAFASTPTLVQLLTDRGTLIREHRAELRAVLQQVSGRLAAIIEQPGASPDTPAIETPGERSSAASVSKVAAPAASDAGHAPTRTAERRRPARHAAALAAPPSEAAAGWRGGPLLR